MIECLKDLEKLLKVLRKQGVYEFEHNGTRLKLGDLPAERVNAPDAVSDPYAGFPAGELSPTQLAFYSSGGIPEEDPELRIS